MKRKNKRVIIAMSGGIDSSVAAALLKKGLVYPELGRREVIGVFMKFWPQEGRCCSSESEKIARLVAKKLIVDDSHQRTPLMTVINKSSHKLQ